MKTHFCFTDGNSLIKRFFIYSKLYRPRKLRPFRYLDGALSFGMLVLATIVAYYLLPYPGVARLAACVLIVASILHIFTSEHDWLQAKKRRDYYQTTLQEMNAESVVSADVNAIFDGLDEVDAETMKAVDSMLDMDIAKSFRSLGMLPSLESEDSSHQMANVVKIHNVRTKLQASRDDRISLHPADALKLTVRSANCLKASATAVKKPPTKSEIMSAIGAKTEFNRKELAEDIRDDLKPRGSCMFNVPSSMKSRVIKEPATKARKSIIPLTGEEEFRARFVSDEEMA